MPERTVMFLQSYANHFFCSNTQEAPTLVIKVIIIDKKTFGNKRCYPCYAQLSSIVQIILNLTNFKEKIVYI